MGNVNENKGFILNKPFEGSYADNQGKIAHEIIDFVLTDNGKHYLYNNPYGQFVRNGCKYKYMFLTTSATVHKAKEKGSKFYSEFKLRYMIEIEPLHNFGTKKEELKANQEKVKKIIKDKEIKYNGKFLYDIFDQDDETLYVTFKGLNIYEPAEGKCILVKTHGYRYQRNKGYVESNENKDAYDELEKYTDLSYWKRIELKSLDPKNPKMRKSKQTFLEFIGKESSEECYTNMLCNILSYDKIFNNFVKKFAPGKLFDDCNYNGKIRTELRIEDANKIKGGRTDISAQSDKQRIVIENKVFSGLNGVDNENNETQLSVYYRWAKGSEYYPICFITCPDFRVEEIRAEMEEKMRDKYIFVTYKDIAEFLEDQKTKININNFAYKQYYDDVIDAFEKYSYKDKTELFEQLFLNATM